MRLLVDVGNTRIKWRLDDGGSRAIEHRGRDIGALLDQAWADLQAPSTVVIACVAGAGVREALLEHLHNHWPGVTVHVLASRKECAGVRVAYAEPGRFGVDRLAALVAARSRSGGRPVIVMDAGTAVTVDAVDAAGRHLGGLIMPGLGLLRESLLRGTAEVKPAMGDSRRVLAEGGGGLLQDNTLDAVSVGAELMLEGGVTRALQKALAALGADARVYLTGGDAPRLISALEFECEDVPDLVLDGVALMSC